MANWQLSFQLSRMEEEGHKNLPFHWALSEQTEAPITDRKHD
jgi:hypothetical protein